MSPLVNLSYILILFALASAYLDLDLLDSLSFPNFSQLLPTVFFIPTFLQPPLPHPPPPSVPSLSHHQKPTTSLSRSEQEEPPTHRKKREKEKETSLYFLPLLIFGCLSFTNSLIHPPTSEPNKPTKPWETKQLKGPLPRH
ncbi:hypothetical protein F4775DRAFT_385868 [Biscogniauxia sp. FL1348]|nr:hypothetical protein F4775DRAFT_385868 [Biscogniauxia sp. FL1348]